VLIPEVNRKIPEWGPPGLAVRRDGLRMRSLTLLAAVLVALPVGAAESEFKAMFLKHWQMAKEFTLALAEAMPAEGYDFKPNKDR
jgi:hypothetical protein